MLVYVVTNKVNGKRYIGQTSQSLSERWRTHSKLSAERSKTSPHLYNAIRKYGVVNFEVEPLIFVGTKEQMDFCERSAIQIFETRNPEKGYNLTDGGDGVLGLKHTEASKEKNRQAHLGRKHTEASKKLISQFNLGRRHSESTKEKMSKYIKTEAHCQSISISKMGNKSRTGMKASAEEIRKRSESLKGRKLTEAHKASLRVARHRQHHVYKNIVNPKCLLCREGSNTNV